MLELVQLSDALDGWVSCYEGMTIMAESFHESLNFPEALALADLLAVTGRNDLAASLLASWAEGDPEAAEHDYPNEYQAALERFQADAKE